MHLAALPQPNQLAKLVFVKIGKTGIKDGWVTRLCEAEMNDTRERDGPGFLARLRMAVVYMIQPPSLPFLDYAVYYII